VSREDLLARLADRLPRAGGGTARRVVAVVLGWLVLMTVWGFGRAWHGGWAPVELVVGLVGAVATTIAAWPRGRR
jgi:hypothetical protein